MKPWPPRDYLVWVGAPIFQGLLGGQGARAGKGLGRTWAPPAFPKEIGNACVFQVTASVGSEAGEVLTSVTPKQALCDGQWHSVAGMMFRSLLFTG